MINKKVIARVSEYAGRQGIIVNSRSLKDLVKMDTAPTNAIIFDVEII